MDTIERLQDMSIFDVYALNAYMVYDAAMEEYNLLKSKKNPGFEDFQKMAELEKYVHAMDAEKTVEKKNKPDDDFARKIEKLNFLF